MNTLILIGQAVVSSALLVFFLEIFFEPRIKSRLVRYSLAIALFCAVNLTLNSGIVAHILSSIIVQARLIATVLLFGGIAVALFKGQMLMRLFLAWLFYLLMLGMEYAFIFLGNALIQWQVIPDISSMGLFAMWLASRLIIFVVVLLVAQLWRRRGSGLTLRLNEWCIFLYFPLFTIAVIISFLNLPSFTDTGLAVLVLGMLVMNLLIVYLLHSASERRRIEYETQLIKQKYNSEINAMQTFRQASDGQRRLIHDFHNHTVCVGQLIEAESYDKAKEYLHTITQTTQNSLLRFHTNNDIIDAILNQKYLLAEGKDIHLQVDASDLSSVPMADEDIVSVLSNVLDNAIEATEKVAQNRVIRVKLVNDKDEFLISVANPVAEDITIIDDVLPTTKTSPPGKHGIGLLSVKATLEKYDADYAMQCENKTYLFSAIISQD